jgi:hypothetical protein
VQNALEQNPFSGHVFVFRGRRGDLIKVLWWDGDGLNGSGAFPLCEIDLQECHAVFDANTAYMTGLYKLLTGQPMPERKPPGFVTYDFAEWGNVTKNASNGRH